MSDTSQQPTFLELEPLVLPRDTLQECHYLSFSPQTVAAAILNGCSKTEIKHYLQSHDRGIVERQISDNIQGRHARTRSLTCPSLYGSSRIALMDSPTSFSCFILHRMTRSPKPPTTNLISDTRCSFTLSTTPLRSQFVKTVKL
jgi:hypothetical protein